MSETFILKAISLTQIIRIIHGYSAVGSYQLPAVLQEDDLKLIEIFSTYFIETFSIEKQAIYRKQFDFLTRINKIIICGIWGLG